MFQYPVNPEKVLRMVAILDHQVEIKRVMHVPVKQKWAIFRDAFSGKKRRIELTLDLHTRLMYGIDKETALLIMADLADGADLEVEK